MASSPDNWPENHGYINQGTHEGDVYFGRVAPPPYHQNAIKCHQCEQHTWRNTPDCVHCGADIKGELECRRLRREIGYMSHQIDKYSLWLIGTALVMLLSFWMNVMWLAVVSFAICALLSAYLGKLQQRKEVFRKRLYQLN